MRGRETDEACARCGQAAVEASTCEEIDVEKVTSTETKLCASCGYRRTFITISGHATSRAQAAAPANLTAGVISPSTRLRRAS